MSENKLPAGYKDPFHNAGCGVEPDRFKVWFAKSKVVGSDGAPLVVYHGSKIQFDAFDNSKSNDGAHFFTEIKEHALHFGDILYEVYLSIQNPLIINDDVLVDMLTDEDVDNSVLPRDYIEDFVKEARDRGYDGLIIEDFGDLEYCVTVYLPMESHQIKSARHDRRLIHLKALCGNAMSPLVSSYRKHPIN